MAFDTETLKIIAQSGSTAIVAGIFVFVFWTLYEDSQESSKIELELLRIRSLERVEEMKLLANSRNQLITKLIEQCGPLKDAKMMPIDPSLFSKRWTAWEGSSGEPLIE